MSYTKQTWANGDIITAEKLNHMEDGIAGGTLVIGGFSYNDSSDTYTGTSDKTWQEIDNAFVAGVRCVVVATGTSGKHMQLTVTEIGVVAGNYYVSAGNNLDATTTSADGYPTIETT